MPSKVSRAGQCLAVLLITALLLLPQARAAVYSPQQNRTLWALRLQANAVANQQAGLRCQQASHALIDFGDDDRHISYGRDKALALQLMAMGRADQNARAVEHALRTEASKLKYKQVDADNLPALKAILATGFPTPAQVGEKASFMALGLVIHADTAPDLQRATYRQLQQLVKQGQLSDDYPALLAMSRLERPNLAAPIAGTASAGTASADAGHRVDPAACYIHTRDEVYRDQLRQALLAQGW